MQPQQMHLESSEEEKMTGFQKLMLIVLVMGTMFFIQRSMLG